MLLENWSDKVSVYWDFSLGPVTFVANIMLIIIILKYTPESTKAYSSIILAITIADCASLIGNFMTSTRIMPRDTQLFMIFRGACSYCFPNDIELKSKFCLYWYAFQIQFYILNHIILIFSYIYRMVIITNPMKHYSDKKPVYIGLVTYSTFHFCYFNWVYYKGLQPMEVVNREISKIEPEIVGSGATYNGIIDLTDPSQVVFNFLSVTSSSAVIVVAVFCHWRIVRSSKKFQYSESVKKLHRSLEMVFAVQTVGPFFSFITSMMYVGINQVGASTHTTIFFENLLSRPMVLMYIVNPIVTFFYISPYRKALQKWFRIPTSVIVGYSIQVQFYILNHFVLIFSYIFRMLIITNPMKPILKTKLVYIGLFSYSSFHFCYCNWVYYKAFQPMEVINIAISKYKPEIVGSGATYYGILDLSDPSQIVFMALSIISSSIVIVIAVFCQWRISRFSKNYQYSESVKELHRSLEMVFSAQTIGPVLSCITSIMYIITNQEGSSTHTSILLENLMTRPVVLMYIVNPVVTFFYISPYRKALQKWFRYSRSAG